MALYHKRSNTLQNVILQTMETFTWHYPWRFNYLSIVISQMMNFFTRCYIPQDITSYMALYPFTWRYIPKDGDLYMALHSRWFNSLCGIITQDMDLSTHRYIPKDRPILSLLSWRIRNVPVSGHKGANNQIKRIFCLEEGVLMLKFENSRIWIRYIDYMNMNSQTISRS
jgi:hypothetical protein